MFNSYFINNSSYLLNTDDKIIYLSQKIRSSLFFLYKFLYKVWDICWYIPILLCFCYTSGFDLIILNDENLLCSIVLILLILSYYECSNFLVLFHKETKYLFIKEYYYKFYLIKIFYLTYVNYLKCHFFVLSNYYKYYNSYNTYLNNILLIFNLKGYSLFFKFFFNYLNIYLNLILLNFSEIKFLTIKNIYYLLNISTVIKI